jgi:signal transduction histidine kinase
VTTPATAANNRVGGATQRPIPAGSVLFALLVVFSLGLVFYFRLASLTASPDVALAEFALWVLLVLAMNLLPVNDGLLSFTLDTPILLTVALLYPPEVAALIALVGSMDIREVFGGVDFLRALFNRTQIALSVFLASLVYRFVTDGALDPWVLGAIGTGVAMLTFHFVNVLTVSTHSALRSGTSVRHVLGELTVGPLRSFLATYLGYGVLALVLAHLYLQVGIWSVALFLIPLMVARQMLVRGGELTKLTKELRQRERLLERLFDRIIEERRDERLRIATGLHDDVLQSLIRISQLGAFLTGNVPENTVAGRDAREVHALSKSTIDSLRGVVSDLQRSPVGKGGLIPSIRALAQDLQLDWRTKITVSADDHLSLSPETQLVGYQVTREALMNSLKHASASEIRVSCRMLGESLVIDITDDGLGFEPDLVDDSDHFGLGLMQRRVELAGGEIELRSHSGSGTTVAITLPSGAAKESPPGPAT